jgi:hypothetical protein
MRKELVWKGKILDQVESNFGADFAFVPKGNKKVDQNDVIQELFDLGMWGEFYALFLRVPDEYPADLKVTEIYSAEQAIRILAQWLRWTVIDNNGQVIADGNH